MADQANQFDVQRARADGHSDDDILQYLGGVHNFDVKSALRDGYTKQALIDHLSGAPPTPPPLAPNAGLAGPAQPKVNMQRVGLEGAEDTLENVANQPLTSHVAATEAGAASVGQGLVKAAEGGVNALQHPLATAGNVLTGVASLPSQISQVPGAIRDINASPNAARTYGQIAGQTGGEALGQAALAEGAGRALSPAINAVGKIPVVARTVENVRNLRDVPKAISSDTVDAANDVASKEGLPKVTATTANEAHAEMSENWLDRADQKYKVVDTAVNGDIKPTVKNIRDLKEQIARTPIQSEKIQLTQQLFDEQKKLSGLVAKATRNGVPDAEQIMRSADADYAKGKAAERIVSKTLKTDVNGHPHPGGYRNALARADFMGDLEQAYGPDGAEAMKNVADEGLKRFQTKQGINQMARHPASIPGRILRRGVLGKE